MKKKILSLILACTLLIGGSINVFAAELPSKGVSSKTEDVKFPVTSSKKVVEPSLKDDINFIVEPTKSQLKAIKTLFNAKEYAEMYPDVVKAVGNSEDALWNHFVKYGLKEGRSLNKTFNVFVYRSCYPDLQKAYGGNLIALYEHYASFGIKENRALISLEAARKSGITVIGMNGKILVERPKYIPSTVASSSNSSSENSNSSKGNTVSNPNPSPIKTPTVPTEPFEPSDKPDEGHVHNYQGDYVDNGKHRMYCFECGEEDTSQGLVNCTYDEWTSYDGLPGRKHEKNCMICGHVDADTIGDCEDTNDDGKCDVCGGEVKKETTVECSHSLQYKDNGDGTHSLKCTKCDYIESLHENKAHNFNDAEVCEDCGANKS